MPWLLLHPPSAGPLAHPEGGPGDLLPGDRRVPAMDLRRLITGHRRRAQPRPVGRSPDHGDLAYRLLAALVLHRARSALLRRHQVAVPAVPELHLALREPGAVLPDDAAALDRAGHVERGVLHAAHTQPGARGLR